jgi:hypothetical protein
VVLLSSENKVQESQAFQGFFLHGETVQEKRESLNSARAGICLANDWMHLKRKRGLCAACQKKEEILRLHVIKLGKVTQHLQLHPLATMTFLSSFLKVS